MKALVTGGGGFLGKAIIRQLLTKNWQIRSLSRTRHPALVALGVEHRLADVADANAVDAAVAGCDLVFHTAAKAGIWGPYREFYQTNVQGTRNVIAACRRHAIKRLIHTSSPSVVFDGRDMEGVDERIPYPEHYHAFYPETKAEAERLVLQANGPELATVALRPHLIWGPEDNHLIPRIIERGRQGRLRRIGSRECLVDTIYIDNAARAHLLAGEQLGPGSSVAGKVYFLSQGEPLPLWTIVDRILAAAGVQPVSRQISPGVAYTLGWLLEKIYAGFRLPGEPPMTRFLARELSTAHWFDISAARNDFGYQPEISFDQGMDRLQAWLQQPAGQGPSP